MNSVSEALVYGASMVVIPLASDQPVNAWCVEKLGVGKSLKYSAINSNILEQAVLSVASDCDIKRNLDRIQKMIKEAPGNKGGAEMVIRYYKEKVR